MNLKQATPCRQIQLTCIATKPPSHQENNVFRTQLSVSPGRTQVLTDNLHGLLKVEFNCLLSAERT